MKKSRNSGAAATVDQSEGKTILELPPEQRRQLRPMLLQSLAQTGANVMWREVRGHCLAIIVPGDGEVIDADCGAVWDAVIAEAETALRVVREAASVSLAVTKGGKP